MLHCCVPSLLWEYLVPNACPVNWYSSEVQAPAWPIWYRLRVQGPTLHISAFVLVAQFTSSTCSIYRHLSKMCSCRSSKNSSPKRGRLSPPRGNLSPKRDVSPKPSRGGTLKGPFVLSPNPSAFSLSTLPSALQAGDAGRVAPLPGVGDFPELAAMEADFQRNLARGVMPFLNIYFMVISPGLAVHISVCVVICERWAKKSLSQPLL